MRNHSPTLAAGLLLAALLLPAAATPAQTPTSRVSPADLAQTEGPGGDDYPLAVPSIRYQQIHDDLATMALVEGISFRRDGMRTTPMGAWSVELELFMSTAPVTSGGMTATFAANRGGDHTRVIARKWFNLPALPLPATAPAPFTVHLLFDQPFPFKAKGSLLWEMVVHGNKQGAATQIKVLNFLDAQAPTLAKGPSSAYGQGCPGTTSTTPTLTSWLRNDGYFRGTVGSAPPLTGGLVIYGSDDKKFFFYNLPYDLKGLGAPGCSLLCNHVNYMPFTTDGFGTALVQAAGIGINPFMHNVPIYGQAVVMDVGANALGLTVSGGVKLYAPTPITAGRGVSRTYSLGNTGALLGTLNAGYGLVASFRLR